MAPKFAKSVSVWPFLPFDIVVEILSRLPVKSLLRFRCVCRKWSSLTYDPHFINKHLHRVPSSLSFMSRRVENNVIKLYDLFPDGTFAMHSSYWIRIKKQDVYVMSNIVHGLMCAYGNRYRDKELFLLNPFTRESAQLLPSRKNSSDHYENFGFGYDVTNGKYKLVRLFFRPNLSKNKARCDILTLGTHEWRYGEEVPCQVTRAQAVYIDGAIYWKGVGLGLLRFDVKEEKFVIISGPPYTLPHSSYDLYESRLFGSKGHLYVIYREPGCLYFKIWVMNNSVTDLWINLYDIDASSLTRSFGFVAIFSIEDDKALLVLSELRHWERETFFSYDTRRKTFLKLCDNDDNCSVDWLALCSESLISPRKLIGNVAQTCG